MDYNQHPESVNENISEAIFRSDREKFIYVNKAFLKMFGFAEEELINHPIKDLYYYSEDYNRLISKLRTNKFYENEEVRFVRKDGTTFIGLISTRGFSNDTSSFWDGAIRDITAEREALNRARSREQLLASINQNINEAIYRSENQKGIIYVNEEFQRMFGFSSFEEIAQFNPDKLYKNPDQRKRIAEEVIEKGSIKNRELAFRRKDGSTFWGTLSSNRVVDDKGKIFFDGAVREVTKEKEAERELLRYAKMQRILIDLSAKFINVPLEEVDKAINESLQALGSFVSADRSYVFVFDNEARMCHNTHEWCAEGISKEIHNNQNLSFDLMPELLDTLKNRKPYIVNDVADMREASFKEFIQQQGIKSYLVFPLIHHKECVGTIGFDWVKEKIVISDKEIVLLELFAEMLINVRIRTEQEKEQEKLYKITKDQNQRLKDFSYITSHNFRSSVANLLGLISLIEDDPTNEAYLQMIKSTSLKLNLAIDAINDLLNFEKDLDKLEKKSVPFFEVVHDIIILNKKFAEEKGIEFVIDIPDSLQIRILPAYLQSILHNLITNAMKYGVTEKSKKIFIEANKVSGKLVCIVRDQGKGIDLKRHGNKMFQLGSRFHPDTESGHGMGLYMTKRQVEAVNGEIMVKSEVDKGTTFKVIFNG